MKIRDMVHVKRIQSAAAPLERWYNRLLDKEPEEMTASDILRALRQRVFVEIAEEMLIRKLQDDAFAGDLMQGELMETLAEFSPESIAKFRDAVGAIVMTAELNAEQYAWACDDDKRDFLASVGVVKSNLLHCT